MSVSYFLSGLNDDHQRLLADAHIGSEKFMVDTEFGLLLEDVYLQAALQVLHAEVTGQTPTPYDGVQRLALRGRTRVEAIAQPSNQGVPAPNRAQPPAQQPAVPAVNLTKTLAPLAMQVSKLQAWANLTDEERIERQRLVRHCKTLEQEVRHATEELRAGIAELGAIKTHVEGLRQVTLPDDLAGPLDAFLAGRTDLVGKSRDNLNTKISDLQSARQALTEHMTQPRMSPEQTLDGASEALADAQSLFPTE